ncbi:LysR family transcriptional regulator [Ramlibacter rhizophilus]
MNRIDGSELDGRLLHLLLAVLDSGSITRAAQQLGVTQSAVSHGLERLRALTGDPLFVKSGRGVVPTAHAQALAAPARDILDALRRFAHPGTFDPARWEAVVTIAANDFQRDLLLPPLASRLRVRAPGVVLRVIPSGVPRLEMLRRDECQLVISPRPPDGADVLQQRLFTDRWRVFYDPSRRAPPRLREEYLAASHATVVYDPHRGIELDQRLEASGLHRRFAVMVPGFAALAAFLRGSELVATAPGLLARHTLTGLAHCEPPVPCEPLPMYALWHLRHQHEPAHQWLRAQLLEVVPLALEERPVDATVAS